LGKICLVSEKVDPDPTDLYLLLWLFVVSDDITGKVKIGIEEFKEDIISACIDRPSVEEYLV
jgi:hypothetical protein